MTDRVRFDPELLDEHNPFEIDDDNAPHLAKHSPYTVEDLRDAWEDPAGVFVEASAGGPADWMLVARLPGGDIVEIPLARSAPRTGGPADPSASIRLAPPRRRVTNRSRGSAECPNV